MTSFTFTWNAVTVTVQARNFNQACELAGTEIVRVAREAGVAV